MKGATEPVVGRAPFTLGEVAEVTGGRLVGGAAEQRVRGVAIDSRRVVPGVLFVALRGARHDGHDFLEQAARGGAAAAVVERGRRLEALPCIEVDAPLEALGLLAARHRRRWGGRLVAVTGSVGKTTTKEAVARALAADGTSVLATAGNLNNLVGLPLTLLALEAERAAVVELGADRPGEIAALARIASPDVGVVTAVSEAHLGGFGSLRTVAAEKGALFGALGEQGAAVLSEQAEAARPFFEASRAARKVRYGRAADCPVRLLRFALTPEGRTLYEVEVAGQRLAAETSLLGEPGARAVAAAVAVAHLEGRPLGALAAALREVALPPGRLRLRRTRKGPWVLDDAYNASPASMEAALRTLGQLAALRGARPVAVLGDMLELGDRSAALHERVARAVAEQGVGLLVAVGEQMGRAAAPLAARGLRVVLAEDATAARAALGSELRAGDLVLVKASRALGLEDLVEALVGGAEVEG